MDWITVLIFAGFVLSGFCCGLLVGYPLGRKSVWNEVEEYERRENILEAEEIW